MSPVCDACGGTGYAVRTEYEQVEILRNAATGRVMTPGEIMEKTYSELQLDIAAGSVIVERKPVERKFANPNRFCRECDTGRDREHHELANTPVIHGKRTGTKKSLEDENDAS